MFVPAQLASHTSSKSWPAQMRGTRKEVLAAKVSSKKVEEEWVVGYYALKNFYTHTAL